MIDLNPLQNLAGRLRAGGWLSLVAGWLAAGTTLLAQNPPTYVGQIDGSTVPGGYGPGVIEPKLICPFYLRISHCPAMNDVCSQKTPAPNIKNVTRKAQPTNS